MSVYLIILATLRWDKKNYLRVSYFSWPLVSFMLLCPCRLRARRLGRRNNRMLEPVIAQFIFPTLHLPYNKLNKVVNTHVPFKTVSKRRARQLSKPWIPKGIRKSIKIKNSLYLSNFKDQYTCRLYRNKITIFNGIFLYKWTH